MLSTQQTQSNQQQTTPNSNNQPPGQNQTSKQATGIVTKILDNFGFIDDSIFFPLSAVKGIPFNQIKVGDKVYFECTFSQNLPFKWNASFVQLVQTPLPASHHPSSQQPQQHPPTLHHQQQPQTSPYQQHPQSQHRQPQQHPTHPSLVAPSVVAPTIQPQQHQTSYQQSQQPQQTTGNNTPGSTQTSSTMYHQQQHPGQYSGYHPQQQQQQQQPKPPQGQPGQYPGYPQQTPFQSGGHVVGTSGPNQPSAGVGATASSVVNNPTAGTPATATVDLVKVQQAVAHLTQFYPVTATAGQATSGPAAQGPGGHRGPPQPGPGGPTAPNHQYGGPGGGGGQTPSIQYTTTPGSAFITSQFNNATGAGQNKTGVIGGQRPGGGRWDHPRDDVHIGGQQSRFDQHGPTTGNQQKMRRDDPRTGARFGQQKTSRFNDSDTRFAQPQPPQNQQAITNEDRFAPNFPPNLQPSTGSDFRDNFRKDSQSNIPNSRDKDFRHSRDRGSDKNDRRNRDRRGGDKERDRSKRSISPSNSISSSSGRAGSVTRSATSQTSSGGQYDFLPKGRRYEPCNLPKTSIVKNTYNQMELKNRLGGSVHIPSDLKQIIYNDVESDFDLFHMPKPISYKIQSDREREKDQKDKDKDGKKDLKSKSSDKDKDSEKKTDKNVEPETTEKTKDSDTKSTLDSKAKDSQKTQDSSIKSEKEESESKKSNEKVENVQDEESRMDFEEEDSQSRLIQAEKEKEEEDTAMASEQENEKKVEVKSVDKEKPNSESQTKSDTKDKEKDRSKKSSKSGSSVASTKYNVKVLLFSLPSLAEIYERLFGHEFASYGSQFTSGSSLSSSKNQVSHIHKLFLLLVQRNSNDGYSLIGGKFQKDLDGFLDPGTNSRPNLVKTAIRIVWEQCHLNLSACRQWRVFSTFVYNRDNCLNENECGYEITKIYVPDVWSAVETMYQPLTKSTTKNNKDKKSTTEFLSQKTAIQETEVKNEIKDDENKMNDDVQNLKEKQEMIFIKDVPNEEKRDYLLKIQANMASFKVIDLKNELDKMDVKYDSRLKKDQLFQRLQEVVQNSLDLLENVQDSLDVNIAKQSEISLEQEQDEDESKAKLENVELTNHKDEERDDRKRKLEDGQEPDSKKSKTESDEKKSAEEKEPSAPSASYIKVKGHHLTTVSLHNALNPHRFDQFELIVVAELLRDSLLKHFSGYIHSALLYQIQQQQPLVPNAASGTVPANYCHLAFSYFDRGHCGYIPADDLNQLWQMSGREHSRKSFQAMVSSLMSLMTTGTTNQTSVLNERIVYMFFQQPPAFTLIPKLSLEQQTSLKTLTTGNQNSDGQKDQPLIVERNSIQYNVDELIKQSEQDQKVKVTLQDTLSSVNKLNVELKKQVEELEQKQKKMSAATGRQNDELCAVKRDRDQLKSKNEQLKKFWSKTFNDYNSMMKTLDVVKQASISHQISGGQDQVDTAQQMETETDNADNENEPIQEESSIN